TQPNARDRYQTVPEFWQELHDAAMPQTRLLKHEEIQQRSGANASGYLSAELSLDAPVAAVAPPRPRFETSSEMRQEPLADPEVRPQIVVPRPAGPAPQPMVRQIATFQPHRVTVAVPANGKPPVRTATPDVAAKPRRRLRKLVVSAVLVLTFAGL